MTYYEAVIHYTEKKQQSALNKQQIIQELQEVHKFSSEDTQLIIAEIADNELIDLQNKKSFLNALGESRLFSYFFLIFAIIVIVTSVYYLQQGSNDPFQKYMPYVMILGGVFLILRHGAKIIPKK